MKIRLSCTYHNERGEKVGEYGDVLDLPQAEADPLVRGGSAELVEPPKKSERDI